MSHRKEKPLWKTATTPGSRSSNRQQQVPTFSLRCHDRIVRANGVDLCVQTFGDSANLPILLIHGASTSMLQREAPYSPECVE
jgi:hypothetical protein